MKPCGCRNVESCHRCVPSAGLWLTLGAVGVLAAVSEGVRRRGSGNTSSPLADAILADEAAVGPFYEEVLQPFLWDWAGREAKKRVRGESLHAIDTGSWEDVVRQWIRWTQGRAVPAAEITRAALALARHFDPLWNDWADVRVEEQMYPEGSAARSQTAKAFRRHWDKQDPSSRAVLYRGQPEPVYPFQSFSSGLSTRIPFIPTGEITVERREGGPFGTRRTIHAIHEGEQPEGGSARGERLPNTLIETWVERADGKYVASESWLGDRTYLHPPTKAEFDAAWRSGKLPTRGTRVPPDRAAPRRYRSR